MRFFIKGDAEYAEITTRAPVKMHLYIKALSFALNLKLSSLQEKAVEEFLNEEPWKYGLKWRQTKGLTKSITDTVGVKQSTGWMQVNIRIKKEIALEVERLASQEGVNVSSLMYTILYWLSWYKYPPLEEQKRREEKIKKGF